MTELEHARKLHCADASVGSQVGASKQRMCQLTSLVLALLLWQLQWRFENSHAPYSTLERSTTLGVAAGPFETN